MRQQNKEQDMLRDIWVGLLSDKLIYGRGWDRVWLSLRQSNTLLLLLKGLSLSFQPPSHADSAYRCGWVAWLVQGKGTDLSGRKVRREKPLLALLGYLIIQLLGVLCSASLKELPQLLEWCKPFVHPLKSRTLETNCVWEQVKLLICVLKILILFLIRMHFVQWQGWKVLPKNWLAA